MKRYLQNPDQTYMTQKAINIHPLVPPETIQHDTHIESRENDIEGQANNSKGKNKPEEKI